MWYTTLAKWMIKPNMMHKNPFTNTLNTKLLIEANFLKVIMATYEKLRADIIINEGEEISKGLSSKVTMPTFTT